MPQFDRKRVLKARLRCRAPQICFEDASQDTHSVGPPSENKRARLSKRVERFRVHRVAFILGELIVEGSAGPQNRRVPFSPSCNSMHPEIFAAFPDFGHPETLYKP